MELITIRILLITAKRNNMAQLHETLLGRKLIEGTLPDIVNQLKSISKTLDYDKSFWLGKEVQIYPGDTRSKWGKIVDMNAHGVTFLITKNWPEENPEWPVGKHKFIAYSSKLTFIEI